MKTSKGVVTLSLGFALRLPGCDDLTNLINEKLSDKTALKSALASANSAKSGVAASVDGSDVLGNSLLGYGVTAEQLKHLRRTSPPRMHLSSLSHADQKSGAKIGG
ncbi:MAG: hypothetical protein LBG43_03985 [Treponema sp.]|nr:hypothetical protein [Treponema sp.]